MKRYIYLDTETGGLFPAVHALLSIGAVAPNGDSFHRFITVESQPGKSVDPEAVKVNGYTPEEWARRGARPLAVVMEDLREWLAGYPGLPIVAHNEGFDRGFLMEAERVTGVVMPHRDGWRCSQRLMLELMDLGLVPEGSARLDRLAQLAGVGIDRGAVHDALVDAMVTRAGHEWLQGKLMALVTRCQEMAELLREGHNLIQESAGFQTQMMKAIVERQEALRLLGQATEALTACRRALWSPNHCADPTCEVPSCMARRAIEAIEKAGMLEKQEGGAA